MQPGRKPNLTEGAATSLAQQLPAPREIAGEEQTQQEPDTLHRLNRPEVHLRIAPAGPAAEEQEQHRQKQRASQRHIGERRESGPAEVHQRHHGETGAANQHALRVSHEQRGVAKRIGAAQHHRETDGGQQMDGVEECEVSMRSANPPDERNHPDPGQVQRTPAQGRRPERLPRADHEAWFDQGQIVRREERDLRRPLALLRLGPGDGPLQAVLVER